MMDNWLFKRTPSLANLGLCFERAILTSLAIPLLIASAYAQNLTTSASPSGLLSVGIGPTAGTTVFDLMDRPGFTSPAVPTFYPTASNSPIALDIMPNGTPDPAYWEPYGVAWFDDCDTDFSSLTASGRCIHLGARQDFLEIGSRTYSFTAIPTSVKDLHLAVEVDNYYNGTYTHFDGIIINGSTGQVSAPQGFYTPIGTPGYTVSALPRGTRGQRAYVIDSRSCSFLGPPTGGGSTFCPVIYNGSAWVGGG